MAGINKETQFICFFVRPDSFRIFQIARGLAWVRDISVTCEMLDERDTINFGAEGFRVLPQ